MKKILSILSVMLILSFSACSTGNDASLGKEGDQGTNSVVEPASTPVPGVAGKDDKDTPQEKSLTPKAQNNLLKIHYIDVGQGDSILVQTPGGRSMLIDAGKNDEGDKVVSYIRSQNIGKIDVLVGTHPHEDHIGGMDNVVNSFGTDKIYMPKKSTDTKTFLDVLDSIRKKGLKVTTATAGVLINLDPKLKVEMLAPNSADYEDLNNFSAVIKLTYNKTSFLFTGDAQKLSEKEMLKMGYNLQADVLKVGHHGSNSSTTASFLKAVSPKYAVISVGKGNDYKHPHSETLNRLTRAKVIIYRTDEQGTIIATSNGQTIQFDDASTATKP